MNITIQPDQGDYSTLLLFIAMAWGLSFLFTLARILTRKDFDPVTRLTWVLVVIFVPLFGLILYVAIAPPTSVPHGGNSETLGTPWADNSAHTHRYG